MKTGFRGAFVISWSQTEIDGQWAAPISMLRVGATFFWSGEAVRVDGPSGVLVLAEDMALADLRRRAAALVRKLLLAAEVAPEAPLRDEISARRPERGFSVTDGRQSWTLTVIPTGRAGVPLLMFLGDPPPCQCDLWVVSHNLDPAVPPADVPGGVICFTPGTAILTETGPRAVESLAEGDRIQTKDSGPAEILWIGRRRLSGARLHAMPHLAPVRLREGALDQGVPDAGLLVSPDHRLVLRGGRARALFNADEVLVTARDLVNDRSVTIERGLREVTYIHLLLPRHEIVFANAVETESFHPGAATLATMEDSQRIDLLAHLPADAGDPMSYGPFVRRVLTRSEAAILWHEMA